MPGFVASVGELRDFSEAGLRLDPPQAALADETLPLEVQQYLEDVSVDLADAHWDPAMAGEAPVPADLGRHAAYEVLTATAAHLSFEETDRIGVGLATAEEAVGLVQAFAPRQGFGAMVRAFCSGAMYENLQAVEFYQPMAEAVFVSGAWHRPWAAYPLHDDLLMAAAAGSVHLRLAQDAARHLWITPQGRQLLGELRRRLGAAGVLAERQRALATAQRRTWPGAQAAGFHEVWEELLALAGIQPGSRVLVLGLALGSDALIHQIADRVGAGGAVLVVDPAVAVLRHFSLGLGGMLPPQVRLIPGDLEALPLSDAAADACLAPAFLHLADHGGALAEVRRVVRPGGRVALAVPHAGDLGHGLLREWLQPVLELAARVEGPEPGRAHTPAHPLEVLAQHGFIGLETRPRVLPISPGHWHAAGAWHRVLERAPWRERQKVLLELGARAERLWAAASDLQMHGELLVATVPD